MRKPRICRPHPPWCGAYRQVEFGACSVFIRSSAAIATLGIDLMNTQQQVLRILDEVLSLNGRSAGFDRDTHLLGAIPELDSMAVVSLITSLEDQLGVSVDDDEIDGETFATVGSLSDFVAAKLAP